jgi:hypothetical protein
MARAMWETHWREEWAVLTGTTLSFYQTNRRKPSLRIALLDIRAVEPLPTAEQPFVGYHFLGVECIGRVHYICTATQSQQQRWLLSLGQQIRLASNRHKLQQQRRSKKGRLTGSLAAPARSVGGGAGGGISIAEMMAEQGGVGMAADFDLDTLLDSGASKFIARFEARQWLPRGRLVLNSKRMCFQMTRANMQVCEMMRLIIDCARTVLVLCSYCARTVLAYCARTVLVLCSRTVLIA